MSPLATRRGRDESGSALVITLVVVAIVGIVLSALLASIDGGFRTGRVVDQQRLVSYAADGAVEGSIASIQGDGTLGLDPALTPAPAACPDFNLPDVNGQPITRVTCTGEPGSGRVLVPSSSGANTAIRLVGSDPSEVGLRQFSNNALNVAGDIEVNAAVQIPASSARIVTNGSLRAVGTCDKAKVTAPTVQCAPDDTVTPFAVPPIAAQAVNTTARTAPTCNTNQVVQTLQPGTYTNAAALSSLTSAACSRSIIHFTPGVYYFNFPAANAVWSMTDPNLAVVGGQAAAGWPTTPPPSGAWPLAGPLCDTSASGVQFIFGGTSRLRVDAGALELCPVSSDPKKIVIYGSTVDPAEVLPTGVTVVSGTWSQQSGALAPADGASARTVVTGSSATLGLTGYALSVPPSASLISVDMEVAHSEAGTPNNGNPTLEAVVSGPGFTCAPVAIAQRSTDFVQRSSVLSGCLNSPARLASFRVDYRITTAANRTGHTALDGITIAVRYSTSSVAPQTGCITQTGYGLADDATRCALLGTDGAQTQLTLHGGIYAPAAVLNIALPNTSVQQFRGGLIARALRISVNPSTSYIGPVAGGLGGAPTPAVLADRSVRFRAYDGAGTQLLEAVATFDDGGGATPGQSVTVTEWTVTRP